MWSVTRELMKRNRRTLVPAGIAVALGAFFICATLLFGAVLDDVSIRAFTAPYGGAEYAAVVDESVLWDSDPHVDGEGLYAHTLGNTGLEGVAAIEGVADTRCDLSLGAQGLAGNGRTRSLQAVEASRHGAIMPFDLVDGAWPAQQGQAALDDKAARTLGVGTGDTLTIAANEYGLLSGRTWGAGGAPAPIGTDDAVAAFDAATSGDMWDDPTVMLSDDEKRQLVEMADGTVTVTISGVFHDGNDLYSLSGGAVALDPGDMVALERASLAWGAAYDTAPPRPSRLMSLTHADLEAEESTAVYYSLLPGADAAQTTDAVNGSLDHARVVSRREAGNDYISRNSIAGVNPVAAAILVFASLALFVAALVIANTFRVLLAQRRRTLALLRLIGASTRQVKRAVLMEGAALGLAYSAAGTALAFAAVGILQACGVEFDGARITLHPSPAAALMPVAFVTIVTVLAARGAARQATRVSPMEALRPADAAETAALRAARAVTALLLIAFGIILSVCATAAAQGRSADVTGASGVDTAWVAMMAVALLGAMCTFVGIILTAQAWVPRMLGGLGRLAAHAGPSAAIAAANVQRNPRRVASTGAALLIGVTLVATVATGASCATGTLNRRLDARYSVDAELSATNVGDGMLATARATDGVAGAARVGRLIGVWWRDDDHDAAFRGLEGTVFIVPDSLIGHEVADVFGTHHLEDDAIYVSSSYTGQYASKDIAIEDGDPYEFTFSNGHFSTNYRDRDGDYILALEGGDTATRTLTVRVADFGIASVTDTAMVISEGTAATLGITPRDSTVWMDIDPTKPVGDVADGMDDLRASYPRATLTGTFIIRRAYERVISIAMRALIALLAVSVAIALAGVANTLSLSVVERRRESATLRAIGMTTGQLTASLAWEALLVALGAGITGTILGALYGWMGSAVVLAGFGMWFTPNWVVYIGMLALAAAAAVLASVIPARRAARVPPVAALADAD